MKSKELYEKAELKLILLESGDVIQTSNPFEGSDNSANDSWTT